TGPGTGRAATHKSPDSEMMKTLRRQPPRRDSQDDSAIRRMLPPSRMRWAVLFGAVLAAGAVYLIIEGKHRLGDKSATKDTGSETTGKEIDMEDSAATAISQATDLLTSGDTQGAL